MTEKLVVVGASLAGLRAVEAVRNDGWDGSIVLVGAEEHLPYDRPPLSKDHLANDEPGDSTYREREKLDEIGVELVLGAPALAGGAGLVYFGVTTALSAVAGAASLAVARAAEGRGLLTARPDAARGRAARAGSTRRGA